MSTHATLRFGFGDADPEARIYLHCDGYPEHVLPLMTEFFGAVETQVPADKRFNDPQYLAARFVVWQALRFADDPGRPLSFISLGIASGDDGHIYDVISDPADVRGSKRPVVREV